MNPTRGIDKYPEKGRERYLTTEELARLGEAIREAETVELPWTVDATKPKAKHAPRVEKRRTVIGPHAAAALRLLIFTGARLREKPRADLNKPWRSVAKRAGLLGLRIHDLRHTHASIGAGAGLGVPIIGKLLGHTKAVTTQRYAHLDIDPLRRASEHIGGRIAAAMGEGTGSAKGMVVPMDEDQRRRREGRARTR